MTKIPCNENPFSNPSLKTTHNTWLDGHNQWQTYKIKYKRKIESKGTNMTNYKLSISNSIHKLKIISGKEISSWKFNSWAAHLCRFQLFMFNFVVLWTEFQYSFWIHTTDCCNNTWLIATCYPLSMWSSNNTWYTTTNLQ